MHAKLMDEHDFYKFYCKRIHYMIREHILRCLRS